MTDKNSKQSMFNELEKLKQRLSGFEKVIEKTIEEKVIPTIEKTIIPAISKAVSTVESTLHQRRTPEIDEALRQHMIAEAAYYRWLARGGVSGHELEDWLAAEVEIDNLLQQAQNKKPAAQTPSSSEESAET